MSRLANCTVTSKVVRALKRAGFVESQGGKHTIMVHPDGRYTTVPRHPRIILGTLRKIIKQCGLTEERFIELY
jgi:predicted RNA binding protein YcfA (HicA-like mRNA interferase family)